MHVATKDAVQTEDQAKELGLSLGAHILTSTIEADGATALASEKAELKAKVISISRTASGGIQVQTAVEVIEPAAEVTPAPVSADDQAIAYLMSKEFPEAIAKEQVAKFGAGRVLAQRDKEAATKEQDLDKELEEVLSGKNTESKQSTGTVN